MLSANPIISDFSTGFLAYRTNGRAILYSVASVCRLSSSSVCL